MNALLAGGDRIQALLHEIECREKNEEQSFISHLALAAVLKKTYVALSMVLMDMCKTNTLIFSNGRTFDLSIFCINLPPQFPHTIMGMTLLAQSYVRMFTNKISDQPCIALRIRQNLLERPQLLALIFGFACLNSCFGDTKYQTAVLLHSREKNLSDLEMVFRGNPLFSKLPGENLSRLVCVSVVFFLFDFIIWL